MERLEMEQPRREGAIAGPVPERTGYERLTADEMDAQRHRNVAYQYLCRLEEAKRWMEACLEEELASPTELEESLRNGVILAKLGHFFAPDVVPRRKIYDLDQAHFKACGLHFRHTDNINRWREAMSHVGLPTIFHPETTDIYDKKNMPRVVYCIHALSLFLFRLRLAPQIQDLYGKVKFTDEEISHMRSELDKYGLQLPVFSKIGGILVSELSVDEAAVHAAVLAINEAVEAGVVEQTAAALRNPSALLANLRENLAAVYQEMLYRAKAAKNQHLQDVPEGGDIYSWCLTQAEIQSNVDKVNVTGALEVVDDALEGQDPQALHCALQDPALALRNLQRENADWYLDQLSGDREQKALELGYVDLLEPEEIQAGVYAANERGGRERAARQAVSQINAALRRGVAEETVRALRRPEAQLPEVFSFAAPLYQAELAALQRQHLQGELVPEELFVAVEMLSGVALVNQALEDGDARSCWRSLASPRLGLSELEDSHAQRYFEDLSKQKNRLLGGFLGWNEIQASVNGVNVAAQEESDKVAAIRLINAALEQGDAEKTFTALLLPAAGLCEVALPTAERYHAVLTAARRQKAQVTGDAGAMLWWEEIQEGVSRANQDTQAAKRMALGLAAINQAIKEGNAAQTVRVLRNPDVSLCGVVAECARAYQARLGGLLASRKPAGTPTAHWVRHRLKDGAEYYFSLQTFEGSWARPRPCLLHATHLSREEIQSTIASVTAAHNQELLWASRIPLVVRLQARMRGFLARQAFLAHRHLFSRQVPAAIKIQACWRGCRQRRSYLERLRHLRRNVGAVTKIQAWVRMWRARRRYRERLRYFRENVKAVIKIQAFVRANKARGDYRLLVHCQDPPLGVVRRFAHLLEQSRHDYWEEAELLELQASAVRGIRSNRQLESDLGLMDLKIGLLVKNRITLQLTRKNKEQLSAMVAGRDKPQGLKALSREKQRALQAYQHLFYQLQTQPAYLARLVMQMPQNKSTKFMESVVFTLYSYAASPREAFLLLQLFRSAVREEIASRVDQIRDILTGNPTVIRLVVSFYRSARGQDALRQILGGPVQEVLQNKTLSLRTSPVEIYKGWINQMESQSGQRSNLAYDVSPEQALSHPEVQRRLDISIRNLLAVTDKFLSAITSSVDMIPYGMRYVAKVLKSSLMEKFPNAAEDEIYKVVGNLLYYRFMNPAVVAPDGFDIVDLSAGVALHPDHRRNLGSVAKILQHAAAHQPFDGENGHLRVVNQYLEEAHHKFRRFFRAACSVPEPEARFHVDKYSEMVALARPVVYITAEELINTHKLLLEHQRSVAPDPQDPLHQLLEDLGELPTLQSLIGASVGNGADGNAEQALSRLGKTEVSLTLSSKFEMVETDHEGSDVKSLLLSTKQMLVDIIQSQPGDSLVEILRAKVTEDQEAAHRHLLESRAWRSARAPSQLRRHCSLAGSSRLPLEEKKRKVLRNLRRLESLGLVDAADQYQAIINQLAQDVRNQRRHRQLRKAELAALRRTLQGLQAKRLFFEEQVDFYQQYIRTCLEGLALKSKPSKKQATLHYTAARLFEKGVLLEIEDLPASQLRNVVFDIIPCEEAGKFQVKAKLLGIEMERFQLHYQDLLQLQYEGVAVMKMFGRARINVNLLIFLLNKKFFKK
ncbi:ras GTPase-activating-like protein IQGAP3 isoform X2 [Hemicordylus capensis]|uniref:ras GTPase-activating-like protein IQGAP3 isoform X2 n=1 Tax=Hemicordylus capensis TaxID=884348 RepID=UPI002302B14A|nr:ras GTPase-activating-like protein IQGAP3 isoform X2 [Hemicordylus capensis]